MYSSKTQSLCSVVNVQLEEIPHSCHLCEFQTFHMNLSKWKFQLHIVPFV